MVRDLQHIHVRYWAGAKAAAGRQGESVQVSGSMTVAQIVELVTADQQNSHLGRVLAACSALVDGRRVSGGDHLVEPGETVEFLPPFAGG